MKRLLTTICFLLCWALAAQAQKFEVETIMQNGDTDKHINFVFLGDGYQEHELPKFVEDVRKVAEDIFQKTPFKEYKNYFNVYAIKVPSNESGASHPGDAFDESSSGEQPVITVDNYFGSTFDYAGIHRLIFATNDAAIQTVLAYNFPEYDQIIVLVNTPYYGGSGGAYATITTHYLASEITIHELGHSFAGLADEYWAGDQFANERPNMTQTSSPSSIRWKNWLYDFGVGIYPYEESPSWYRPHQLCTMRYLSTPTDKIDYCSVCSETTVERIHELASPLLDWSPDEAKYKKRKSSLKFSLQQLKPEPNTLKTKWTLNGKVVKRNTDYLKLHPKKLRSGTNTLTATMVDATKLSRADDHWTVHIYTVSWKIKHKQGGVSYVKHKAKKKGFENTSSKSIQAAGIAQTVELNFYPNPTPDILNINYTLESPSEVQVQLVSMEGKVLFSSGNLQKGIGTHRQEFSLANLSAGTYVVRFFINGSAVSRKIVKAE